MRAFDVGVVPSRREAFGIAALEMMRMKVPVIVSPVGGLPELVRDGETGVILPELSPGGDRYRPSADSERMPRCGRNCRQNAFTHASSFDGGRAVEQIVEIYERLMTSRRTRQ